MFFLCLDFRSGLSSVINQQQTGAYETGYYISCRNLLEDVVNDMSLSIGSSHMINSFKEKYDFRGSTSP